MDSDKWTSLQNIAIAFVIVVILILVIGWVFRRGFLVNDRSLVQYFLESQVNSISAARMLQQKTTNPQLKSLADNYIAEMENRVNTLESMLNSLS